MRIVPLSVFAAREGADLSHGDLLYCYLRDRAHRGLMAVDSATTAGSQPQARSTAEDGRARVSCRARNARSAGEESRRPAVAGSRPASGRERIASLDPPAHAAEERRSPAVKDGLGSGFPADDDPRCVCHPSPVVRVTATASRFNRRRGYCRRRWRVFADRLRPVLRIGRMGARRIRVTEHDVMEQVGEFFS